MAFTHQRDRFNAELWFAETDGSGARRLVSAAGLRAILDEPVEPTGAVPAQIQWIPHTPTLAYDAFPPLTPMEFISTTNARWHC